MRETKKVTIGGKVFEMYTYITGGEARQVQNAYLEGIKFEVGETPKMSDVSADVVSVAQDRAIGAVIVSIDGSKDNIVNTVLDLEKSEFDEVIEEVNKISEGLSKKKLKV